MADHPSLPARITDKLSHSLTNIRLNPVYVRRQRRLESFLRDLPYVGPQAEKSVEAFKAAVREFLQPPSFFEALGVRYVGPIDGHDIEELEQTLAQRDRAVRRRPDPRPRAHAEGPRLPAGRGRRREAPPRRPGVRPGRSARRRPCPTGYTQAFAEAIIKEAEADPRVVAITAAMPGPTGLIPFQARFPDRFFDVGIAEQHAVTGAAGMAMGGLRPVVAIYSHVPQPGVGPGRLRRRPAPPAGRVLPRPRRDHRRQRRQPPRRVRHGAAVARCRACACSRRRARRSCRSCCTTRSSWPTKARWPSATRNGTARRSASTRSASGCTPAQLREGDGSVCILAIGKLVVARREGRRASWPSAGIDATVWDVRCCAPLDPAMIADAAAHSCRRHVRGRRPRRRHRHDHRRPGARHLARRAASTCSACPSRFIPQGKPDRILAQLGLDADGIAAAVRRSIDATPER